MQYKRIIVGDSEIKVPALSLGALPIAGIALLLWLLSGAVSYTHLTLPTTPYV